MEGSLALKDVVRFLELSKSRAELSFRIEIEGDEEEAGRKRSRLSSVQEQIRMLSDKMERTGVKIAIPNEREIARLNADLASCSAKEILEAMKKRGGKTYETLAERGKLIKQNFENRENIAKLALLATKLEKEVKVAVADAVRMGGVSDSIPLLNTGPETANKLAAILGRLGLPATVKEGALVPSEKECEVAVQLQNRMVWVDHETHEKLNANLEKMKDVSSRIQLKNAVRQIKEFSDDEEKEFASMQNEYLKLLKEQDFLLKDFLDEDKITVTVS